MSDGIRKATEDEGRTFTTEEVRRLVAMAYDDAARIVMETRGRDAGAIEVHRLSVAPIAERIVWRGDAIAMGGPLGVPGQGALPSERLTASARGLDIPSTLAEVIALGIRRER